VAGECARLGAVGVLSNDSDFLCMGVPLLPLAETSLDDGVLRSTRYAPAAVAAALALPPARLPLLACLVGNDHIDRARLAAFHARIVPAATGRRAAAVVRAVARVLAGAGAGPAAVLGEAEELALVREMFAAEERAGGAAAEARLLAEVRAARAHYERPACASAAEAEAEACALPAGAGAGARRARELYAAQALSPFALQVALHRESWWRGMAIESCREGARAGETNRRLQGVRHRLVGFLLDAPAAGPEVGGPAAGAAPDGGAFTEFVQRHGTFCRVRCPAPPGAPRMSEALGLPRAARRALLLTLLSPPPPAADAGAGAGEDGSWRSDGPAWDPQPPLPDRLLLLAAALRAAACSPPAPAARRAHWEAVAAVACAPAAAHAALCGACGDAGGIAGEARAELLALSQVRPLRPEAGP
jgi:hypothetical protein